MLARTSELLWVMLDRFGQYPKHDAECAGSLVVVTDGVLAAYSPRSAQHVDDYHCESDRDEHCSIANERHAHEVTFDE
jgi:hypothetical protein